jgi:hypothetical protein
MRVSAKWRSFARVADSRTSSRLHGRATLVRPAVGATCSAFGVAVRVARFGNGELRRRAAVYGESDVEASTG